MNSAPQPFVVGKRKGEKKKGWFELINAFSDCKSPDL